MQWGQVTLYLILFHKYCSAYFPLVDYLKTSTQLKFLFPNSGLFKGGVSWRNHFKMHCRLFLWTQLRITARNLEDSSLPHTRYKCRYLCCPDFKCLWWLNPMCFSSTWFKILWEQLLKNNIYTLTFHIFC